MVSSSGNRNNDVDGAEKHLNKTVLPPDRKPLSKFKFYLDIKNRTNVSKLEAKIKELGGNLDFFLSKEVTHFITDKEGWNNNKGGGYNPDTPPGRANVSVNSSVDSSNTTPCRPKSRADAMLERARRCSNVISKQPLDDAKRWGINIYSVENALTWFDKLSCINITSVKKKQPNYFELKKPFIKFEAFSRNHRPIFRQIHNWPTLNLLGLSSEPGLVSRYPAERNMTRKTRSHRTRNDTAHRPGYCEVCRIEYLKLDEHLESEKHLSFVKDKANFLGLDNLISDGTSFENFLKTNYIAIDGNCIDSEYCAPVTRNKMPRKRTTSHVKMKTEPLSPVNDVATRLRPRNSITNNYIQHFDDLEEELKLEDMIPIRELRSSTRQSSVQVNNSNKAKEITDLESDTWSSGRPKRSCLKGKRISADERLVVDNKSYYKVEVLSSKLRSSDIQPKTSEPTKKNYSPIREENEEEDKGLIVKFKRMRTSELLRLNNEAENFLFPKREESETEDDDVDGDCPNTTVSTARGDSTVLLSSEDESPVKSSCKVKQEILDESSVDDSNLSFTSRRRTKQKSDEGSDSLINSRLRRSSIDSSCSTDTQSSHKRRRRTHAEAFILDNQKYYKFETPGSRLRYHGSLLTQMSAKTPKNGDCVSQSNRDCKKSESKNSLIDKIEKDAKDSKINLDEIKFSFESVPKSEPWYETFQRQDRGDVYYNSLSESSYFWKSLLLPYEMGPIPPLDPRICISTYQEMRKKLLEPCSTSSSAGTNTPEPCGTNSLDSNNITSEDNSQGTEDSNQGTDFDEKPKKKKRSFVTLPSKNPRKSPRQHASTLAILSSLLQQRKRRSRNSESPQKLLPSIPEDDSNDTIEMFNEQTTKEIDSCNLESVPQEIEEILKSSLDMSEEIDIPLDRDIVFHSSPDAIAILEEYEQNKLEETNRSPSKRTASAKSASARKPTRKRKNLTGWPSKATRRSAKSKKEIKDEDESTRDTLISVNAESEEDENLLETNEVSNGVNKASNNKKAKKNEQADCTTSKKPDQSSFNDVNSDSGVQNRTCKKTDSDTKDDRVIKPITTEHLSDRVVDLEKWENAEKVLSAKLSNSDLINTDQFQPFVVVEKIDTEIAARGIRRARSSSSPHRTNVKRSRRMPASPKSPRALRKPRGRWYRER